MDRKSEVFQQLKPACVALGQSATGLQRSQAAAHSVAIQLKTLKECLIQVTREPEALDAKLAEYVFFPIAQVLKASQRASIRCLELCLQCVAILVDQGWRKQLSPQLAAQIVILCTLLGERKPKGLAFVESTDELQSSAFRCLYSVFNIASEVRDVRATLCSDSNFPQLGQTVSILLDEIHDGRSVDSQVAASATMKIVVADVMDREFQAAFLPGIVSKLTKILTPETKGRRSNKVLVDCLLILELLLRATMNGDGNLLDRAANVGKALSNRKSVIDTKWRENAAEQLKPALAKVMRLRSHSRPDVKEALAKLCMALLESCRPILVNCSSTALETIIMIFALDSSSSMPKALKVIINSDLEITTLLQTLISNWLQSLTTIMQGANEQAKTEKLQHISTAYELLAQSGKADASIDRQLASALRDSVVIMLAAVRGQPAASSASPIQSLKLTVTNTGKGSHSFLSPLVQYKGQEETMMSIETLTRRICTSKASINFAAELSRSLLRSDNTVQIANFWLLLQATETALQRRHDEGDLLIVEYEERSECSEYLEELYSFSLALLTRSSDEAPDARLQALALRTLALRAQIAGQEFRYELVDALYPVLHTLATPDQTLQQDSITTLNILASACGYSSVKDLIVQNVDYLTNAVALKLNAFDISPQAPQVLLMMVRLAGPSLLPYLEDTVESIFAALEDYHGYPLLVELLFGVLSVMAEEGVKAPQLAILHDAELASIPSDIDQSQPSTIPGLAALLRERGREELEQSDHRDLTREQAPQQPWKDVDELSEANKAESEEDAEHHDQQLDDTEIPPPAPKTYNLLFKITELTQHFLPSASPALRTSLLTLIRTTVPAIARHENSFLPLINTLWPEVVSRLDDEEPHIIATALDVVRKLCEYAGDFMRTRVTEVWPRLAEIYSNAVGEFVSPKSSQRRARPNINTSKLATSVVNDKHALTQTQSNITSYGDTSGRLIYEALMATFAGIVQHIRISSELFDEALEMLEPLLEHETVAAALQTENADAYWLARFRNSTITPAINPVVARGRSWQFAKVAG